MCTSFAGRMNYYRENNSPFQAYTVRCQLKKFYLVGNSSHVN